MNVAIQIIFCVFSIFTWFYLFLEVLSLHSEIERLQKIARIHTEALYGKKK